MAMLQDVARVVPMKRERRQSVPLSEIEPLINQLRTAMNCNMDEALRLIGYAGGSHYSEWKQKNVVPVLAMNAIKWVLHDLHQEPVRKTETNFNFDELTDLFAALRGLPIGDKEKRALLKKVAAAIVQEPT